MNSTIIAAFAIALSGSVAFAQTVPPAVPGAPPLAPTEGLGRPQAPGNTEAARFNLKFPGGKVREFVAAVAKALGNKPVNVIIPQGAESTVIPPVDVFGVTVSGLFRALSSASKRQILVPGGFPGNPTQASEFGFNFLSEGDDNSPETVWTFHVTPAPLFGSEEPVSAPRVVQYYPVAEYLSDFTVEDITTAIESGWELQGGDAAKEKPATLRFHEETKLLLCAGSNQQIEVIPQVLAGLSRLLGYPRTDNSKITRKAKEIIIPKVEFREATVREAIEFISRKASESDPERKGINILLNEVNGPADHTLTISLADVPLLELLRFISELANLDFEIRDTAIVLKTARTTNSSEGGPTAGTSGILGGEGNLRGTGGVVGPAPRLPSTGAGLGPVPTTGAVPQPRR